MSGYRLRFTDKILDNVHGFIEFTDVENAIIGLPVFKRLQSIKQLGMTNWIFPGAEHTRFIHSLGVMHVADQMAVQLGYSDEQRQLVRLAGLLHDIGHYPLSHVGERAYKNCGNKTESLLRDHRRDVQNELSQLEKDTVFYMQEATNPFHHERITEQVIRQDEEIRQIIETYCGGSEWIQIDNICSIITGNVERNPALSGLVQLMHSEMDADRIDYILRDATFSGTSYGSFELGLLLRNLSRTTYHGAEIIGVHPKGIAIADQFLMNRYYAYTQVFFNRHVSVLEFMAQSLSGVFVEHGESEFPSPSGLLKAVERHGEDTEYLYFTDRAFWDSLHHVTLPYGSLEARFQQRLLRYQELDLTEEREISVNFSSTDRLTEELMTHPIYQNFIHEREGVLPLLYMERFTKHVPRMEYEGCLERLAASGRSLSEGEAMRCKIRRLQEGITILEEGKEPILLCDSPASLMSQLYHMRICIMREYRLPE